MNFNSVMFMAAFLPVTLLAYHTVAARFRISVLLVASLVFYGASGIPALASMIVVIVWAFITAFVIRKFLGAGAIVLAVSVPVLILILFKYLGFILNGFGADEVTRSGFRIFTDVLLPAGVSFYTFEAISYSLDVKDRVEEPERRISHLAAFFAAFPHLIAGPILRYSDVREQFNRIESVDKLNPDWERGWKFTSVGLLGKFLFSDIFSMFIDRVNAFGWEKLTTTDSAYLILAYTFHIYFDFWAYSLIAIGLGLMLDIRFPRNFIEPYLSKNPKEFWRRWHVTLSYWLRDYVYIKMGGNNRYVRNILVIFLLCGLWHGAGWNFVLWGAYHAILVIIYHFTAPFWSRLYGSVQIGLTFVLVSLGWPLFFVDALTYAHILKTLITGFSFGPEIFRPYHWFYGAAVSAFVFLTKEDKWLYNARRIRILDSPYLHAATVCAVTLFFTFSRTFVYFRF